MSNPNDPDAQAEIVQAHRDLVRGKAQRASAERDPSNLFPSMLRNLATMIKNCAPYLVGDPERRVWPVADAGQRLAFALAAATQAAGLGRWTPHDLRRSAVDAMRRAGVDVRTAAEQTGHSVQVMLAIYASASTDDLQRASAALELPGAPAAPSNVVRLGTPRGGSRG